MDNTWLGSILCMALGLGAHRNIKLNRILGSYPDNIVVYYDHRVIYEAQQIFRLKCPLCIPAIMKQLCRVPNLKKKQELRNAKQRKYFFFR